MSKSNKFFFSIVTVVVLVVLPLFTAWWMFFPIAFYAAFFLSEPVEAIIAGFILDLVYFGELGGGWPWLTSFVLAIYIIKAIFRDKLRF